MGVNLGNDYLTRKGGSSMLKKVTEPINGSEIRYYSILNYGSSLAKTMDGNELFLVKSAPTGVPNLAVLSVKEVIEADHEGLKAALDHSKEK